MNGRRDYGRWRPWMGRVLVAVLLFAAVALLFSGHLLAGTVVGMMLVSGLIVWR